jgi:environmental stress-induced protein Ves
MRARILRHTDYRRMRWKNGGGWTTELATFPESEGGSGDVFDWRISIAEIESDGAFSTFPGCDRQIALLDGISMELRFDAAPSVRLERRLQFFPFAGEWQTHGTLLSGAVRDFNVIARRDAVRAEVWHRPLVGPMVFLADAAVTWFVYVAAGQAAIKSHEGSPAIDAGDSLLLDVGNSTGNTVLNGGGELVIVKLTRVADQTTA